MLVLRKIVLHKRSLQRHSHIPTDEKPIEYVRFITKNFSKQFAKLQQRTVCARRNESQYF